MNDEATRLLERSDLVPEARDLLSSLEPSAGMPAGLRASLDTQIAQLASQPVAAAGPWQLGGPAVLGAVVAVGLAAGLGALDSAPRVLDVATAPAVVEVGPAPQYESVRLMRAAAVAPAPPAPAFTAPTRAHPEAAARPAPASLADELKVLAAAKAALPARPREALEQVELHARRYPAGQLSDMREYLRLRAIEHLEPERVASMAEAFLARYAHSAFREDVLELRARDE